MNVGGTVIGILGVWFLAALVVGQLGVLAGAPPLAVPGMLWGLTGLVLLAFWRWSELRAWVLSVDIRRLVAIHVTRFVGIYFLILYGRGELPYAFAVPGGWGDIAIATLALGVIALAPLRGRGGWWAYYLWNVLGLADILMVVITAARLGLSDPPSLRALTQLPLSLLPTFLVPIIISTHVMLMIRLRGRLAKRSEWF